MKLTSSKQAIILEMTARFDRIARLWRMLEVSTDAAAVADGCREERRIAAMPRIKMRLIRAQALEESGPIGVMCHLFDLIAFIEQEGKAYAGCIQGFDGMIEAVGTSEQEVVQNLFDGFSMLVDHHVNNKTIDQFLKEHGIQQRFLNEPAASVCDPEPAEREYVYMPRRGSLIGGTLACAG